MNVLPGDYYGEVTPVPIPNTEVKLSYADGTALGRESRSSPGFFYSRELSKRSMVFLQFETKFSAN